MKTRKVKITEKSVMLECTTRLAYSGWRCLRVPPSIYASKGWCDVIAIRKGVVLFIEFKGPTGKQSLTQQVFQQLIEDAGGNYVLVRSWADMENAIERRNHYFLGENGQLLAIGETPQQANFNLVKRKR